MLLSHAAGGVESRGEARKLSVPWLPLGASFALGRGGASGVSPATAGTTGPFSRRELRPLRRHHDHVRAPRTAAEHARRKRTRGSAARVVRTHLSSAEVPRRLSGERQPDPSFPPDRPCRPAPPPPACLPMPATSPACYIPCLTIPAHPAESSPY